MHGLINRAIQCFVRDTCGPDAWERLARVAELPPSGFEAMFVYDDQITERMLDTAVLLLAKPRDVLLEDVGTYLVSNPNVEPLRRLLRFGGETFLEFLQTVDDLPRRAQLALPDLELPSIEVIGVEEDTFRIGCHWAHAGFGHVLVGMLRTLADDYGALVLLDHHGCEDQVETVTVQVLREGFAVGRPFQLASEGRAS
ncbi:heme NO-binding domain-containing protein [Fluviibacterium sp. S390]|uniref:heme NO-binding domain-containing protein n=1 Tax=Fluviibacterium sp. S390 TaxID=3415139 RepID=UPI003C7BA935